MLRFYYWKVLCRSAILLTPEQGLLQKSCELTCEISPPWFVSFSSYLVIVIVMIPFGKSKFAKDRHVTKTCNFVFFNKIWNKQYKHKEAIHQHPTNYDAETNPLDVVDHIDRDSKPRPSY